MDEIKEDYGEDLLVQTCLNGRMDPSRIWVQVKGTERDCTTQGRALPSVRVKAKQILRWARSVDLVIAVLWDVNNDCGWYINPQGYFDHFDLRDRLDGHVTLKFSRELPFNQTSVDQLAWAARIEHTSRSLQFARNNWEESREMELDADIRFHAGVYYTLLLDFAIAIKVAEPKGGLTKEFLSLTLEMVYKRLYERGDPQAGEVACGQSGPNIKMAAKEALMVAIFEMMNKHCAQNGAPLTLVKEFVAYIYPALFTKEVLDALGRADRQRMRRAAEDSTSSAGLSEDVGVGES